MTERGEGQSLLHRVSEPKGEPKRKVGRGAVNEECGKHHEQEEDRSEAEDINTKTQNPKKETV